MSVQGAYTHPLGVVSSTDRGGALLIVNITGLAIALISVIARIYIGTSGLRRLTFFKDDAACFLAIIATIVQSTLVFIGVSKGNGKSIDLIPHDNLVQIQQIQYAVDIFYILGLFFTKVSVLFLLQRIDSFSRGLWMSGSVLFTTWMVAAVLSTALKCDLRQPWIQYNVQCSGLLARWDFIEITAMSFEAALFVFVLYIVWAVQMENSVRVKVVFMFSTRFLVIVFAGLRLAKLPHYFHSSNPTYDGIPVAIYAQAELHYSLFSATTPLMKSFVHGFYTEHGAISRDVIFSSEAYRLRGGRTTANPGKRRDSGVQNKDLESFES